MNESKLIIVGSYVSENVSGSHRQERYIIRGLELGFKVLLIKPSGNWRGVYEFKCLSEFDNWRKSNILLNYRSDPRKKEYMSKLSYDSKEIVGLSEFYTGNKEYLNPELYSSYRS